MDNDEKLKALTNEPVKVILGGEEFTLRRPTIKDYKKIRAYLKERNAEQKLNEDDAVDFSIFFISILLKEPQYTSEELEDKILVTDLAKLSEIMNELGFTKPQTKSEEISKVEEKVEEKTLTGAGSMQE